MIHARADYNRIQDPEKKIPEDEPVFMVRATDKVAANTVRAWAALQEAAGGDPAMVKAARDHADLMDKWPNKKLADM